MLPKLKPLELSFDFEDRDYVLGDTIDVQVTLTPNGDVDVRGGRVDLVCEEQYSQRATTLRGVRGPRDPVDPRMGGVGRKRHLKTERKERVVHSTVSFLEEGRLKGSAPSTSTARLLVQPTPPPHFEDARALQRDAQSSWTFKWRLEASVNVARGRDQKKQRRVKVKLPLTPAGAGAKPRMSTPKKRTGSAG